MIAATPLLSVLLQPEPVAPGTYVMAAYIAAALLLGGYGISLWQRQRAVRRELALLQRERAERHRDDNLRGPTD